MKAVEFWIWWIVDETSGQRRRTSWRMTEAEALEAYPGAQKVEGTCEVRNLPETQAERRAALPGRPNP